MPEAWSNLLKHSGITRDEKQKNPQAVVKVLEFYTRTSQSEESSKFLTAQRYGNINNDNTNNDTVHTLYKYSWGAFLTYDYIYATLDKINTLLQVPITAEVSLFSFRSSFVH